MSCLSINSKIIPDNYSLSNIYPNPFNQSTTVVFYNEEQPSFELVLYGVLGEQVRVMKNITTNEAIIEKGHLTPGVYFISLQGLGKALRGKLMVE